MTKFFKTLIQIKLVAFLYFTLKDLRIAAI